MDQDFLSIRRNFINTYLDSPIIEGDARRAVIELLEYQQGNHKIRHQTLRIAKLAGIQDESIQMYNPRDLHWLVNTLPKRGCKTHSTESHTIANSIFTGIDQTITRRLHISNTPIVVSPPSILSRIELNRAELFVRYTDRLSCSRACGNSSPVRIEWKDHCLSGNQYFAIWKPPGNDLMIVMPYEGILMMKDMFLSRANVYEAIRVIYPRDKKLLWSVKEVLSWCEDCLTLYGNKGYEILKQLEPISKSFVIDTVDPIFRGSGPLQRLSEQVRDKERKIDPVAQDFQVDKLIKIMSMNPVIVTLVELFGLMKLTGHPLIDPRVGGKSAAHEASVNHGTRYVDALRLRNNWCRLYLEGFVKRTGRWPPLIFTHSAKQSRLYQLFSLRERNLNRHSYPLDEWTDVLFGKHADFEYFANFLDLMDDKSISHYLSEFRATWRKNVKTRSHRRLLLEMLNRPDVSIRAIVDLVESGSVPDDFLIVSLYPKEREFKEAARMFSMMVFEMRAFFTCLEANLADKIFPYLPQQTMTLKKTQIQEKFYQLTKPSEQRNTKRLFLEVDLSRWNLRWRDLPMRMIGRDLNCIFGMRESFTFVHTFFKNCLILVRVAGYEPTQLDDAPPPSSDLLWYDHEGGFEGISQKHWTLATYSMIDLGVKQFDFNYGLVGQADNQVILAHVIIPLGMDPTEYIRNLAKKVTKSISCECEKVGQDAKPEECLESTEVVTYSKDFFISGCDYNMSLKALSRIFPRGTSEFPTIFNCISAIGSGCLAAAEKMKDPVLAYYLQLYHCARYLLSLRTRESVESICLSLRARSKLTSYAIRRLLVLPVSLGGLPLPTVVNYLYKGGSDSLSKDLSAMSLMSHEDKNFTLTCIQTILEKKWTDSHHSISSLLSDPYSIPITRVPLAESRVQQLSLSHISMVAQNREIKEVISTDVAAYEEKIRSALFKTSPFNPAFLADLLDNSVVGVKSLISRMFTATRTVQSLTHGDDKDPGGTILRASSSCFLQTLCRVVEPGAIAHPMTSTYTLATSLRALWAGLTDAPPDFTIVGVTNYVPLGMSISVGWERESIGQEVQVIFDGDSCADYTRGAFLPYLGTETTEKRTRQGYKIITSSSAEKAASALYKMMTQPGVTNSFEQLVSNIARTRTQTDLSALKHLSSRALGGSIAHRYTSAFDLKTASTMSCGTFASHIALQSNFAGVLSGSSLDYPNMFQEDFTCGIGLLNYLYQRNRAHPMILAFVIPPEMEPLPDDPIVCGAETLPYPPVLENNSIVYCTELSLLRQERPHVNDLVGAAVGGSGLESPSRLARCCAAREMRRHASAASVLDMSSGVLRLSLDLLEFRGLGFANIVNGVASAIANHCCEVLFSRYGSDHQWVILPSLLKLSSAFAGCIVHAAEHPMFRKDEFVHSVIMPSEMIYSYYKAQHRVTNILAAKAYQHFTSAPNTQSSDTILLFMDDEESAGIDTSLLVIRKGLIGSFIAGELSNDSVHEINRSAILQHLRGSTSASSKLNTLLHSSLALREYATQSSYPFMSSYFSDLCNGQLIKLVDTTLMESLRKRRQYNMTRTLIPPTAHIDMTPSAPLPLQLTQYPKYDQAVSRSIRKEKPALHSMSYEEFVFLRARGRTSGLDATTVNSFWPCRRALRSATLIILGNGNGGCAAVASLLNVERIVIHDKQSDIRPEFWAVPHHCLPILDRLHTRSTIERSRAGYHKSNGDLQHDETWHDLSRTAPVGAVVVYDIPIKSHEELDNILARVLTTFPGSPLVTRWLLPSTDCDRTISYLHTLTDNLEVYTAFSLPEWKELVIRADLTIHSHPQVPSVLYTAEYKDPDMTGIHIFGGSKEDLWKSTFGDLQLIHSTETILTQVGNTSLLDASIGKSTHGFTYDQWTRVLWCLYALEYTRMDNDKQVSRFLKDIGTSTAFVTIKNLSHSIAFTHSFKVFLTHTLPSLL